MNTQTQVKGGVTFRVTTLLQEEYSIVLNPKRWEQGDGIQILSSFCYERQKTAPGQLTKFNKVYREWESTVQSKISGLDNCPMVI